MTQKMIAKTNITKLPFAAVVPPALAACLMLAMMLGITAPQVAAEPVARVTGPTETQPGNLVILRAEGSVGTGHKWAVIPAEAAGSFLPIVDSAGNQAAVFASATPGRYVFILAVAEDGDVALATHVLTQGGDPRPPVPVPQPEPEPDPTPEPEPPVPPGPSGFRVLILEETAERGRLPAGQLAILTSTAVREYLTAQAAKGPAGVPEWRIWDDDLTADQLEHVPAAWRAAYEDAKRRSSGVRPYVLVTNGQAGFAGPLPATVDQTLALLRKYGG